MPIEKIDKKNQNIFLTFSLEERKRNIITRTKDILYLIDIKDEEKRNKISESIYAEILKHYNEKKGNVRGYMINFSTKLYHTFRYIDIKLSNTKSNDYISYQVLIDKDKFIIKGIFQYHYYSFADGYFNDYFGKRITEEFGESEGDYQNPDEDDENEYDDDGNIIEPL